MNIKAEYTYTVKEASQLTGIHTRKLNRVAVKNNTPKLDNKYIFSGAFLIERFKLKEKDKMAEGVITLLPKTNEIELLKDEVRTLREAIESHHKTLQSHQKLIGLISRKFNESR